MKRELLCTIGPKSRRPGILERLDELGVSLFRINLSHTGLDELPDAIDELQQRTKGPICLDTEGAQVRTASLIEPTIELEENAIVVVLNTSCAPAQNHCSTQPHPATLRDPE